MNDSYLFLQFEFNHLEYYMGNIFLSVYIFNRGVYHAYSKLQPIYIKNEITESSLGFLCTCR